MQKFSMKAAKHCHGNMMSPGDRTSIVAFSWEHVASSTSKKVILKAETHLSKGTSAI